MKKIIVTVLLVLGLSLTGCGGPSQASRTPCCQAVRLFWDETDPSKYRQCCQIRAIANEPFTAKCCLNGVTP